MNYFKIMGIKEDYSIDLFELEKKYLELQKKYHPDNNFSSGNDLKDLSNSIDINNAYKNLKNDYLRAVHLLKINDIDINDSSNRGLISQNILNDFFELSEEIDEIEDKILIEKKLQYLENKEKNLLDDVSMYFQKSMFNEAAKKTMEYKYLKNLVNLIETKLNKKNI